MDRFFRGFAAGLAGGIVRRFLDWSGVFLFGRLPKSTLEIGYALLIHLVLTGALGVVFAFFIFYSIPVMSVYSFSSSSRQVQPSPTTQAAYCGAW